MASPIAHSITGFSIYWISSRYVRISSNPLRQKKFLLGASIAVILANLSDLDLIAGLIFHRYVHHQVTHTFFFALLIGLISAIAARMFHFCSIKRAFFLSTILVSSHVIIDYFTRDTSVPKGCMLFWPVSERYFMFPMPLFIDIWRMTPELTIGFNNLNAAIRELAVGGAILLLTFTLRPFPIPIRRYLLVFTAVMGFTAVIANQPLTACAERQLLLYLGQHPTTMHNISDPAPVGGIVFSSRHFGNLDIFLIQPDGTGRRQLTVNPADDDWPAWSPDGTWIAFQSDRSGNRDIWLMTADGMNKRNLTGKSSDIEETPSWTAGGNQIVFCSHRTGQPELFVMNLDGSGVKQIAGKASGRKLMPRVSPVTDFVAYTGEQPPFPGWNIFSVSLNGGAPVRISPSTGCRGNWSPDGSYMVYVGAGSGNTSDLYIFEASGGPHRKVTFSSQYDYDPCFSPTGDTICFCRSRAEFKNTWDLWTIDIRTGDEKALTDDGLDNRNPSWH
ncbi:PD40 domain-containing protein [bacterium]|nr:PD40 domain-containing protein [candidate division CSSED10-310 bacterium]